MYCYLCGREINNSAVFCEHCGTRVPSVAAQQTGQIPMTQDVPGGYISLSNQVNGGYNGAIPQPPSDAALAFHQTAPAAAQPVSPIAPAFHQAPPVAAQPVSPITPAFHQAPPTVAQPMPSAAHAMHQAPSPAMQQTSPQPAAPVPHNVHQAPPAPRPAGPQAPPPAAQPFHTPPQAVRQVTPPPSPTHGLSSIVSGQGKEFENPLLKIIFGSGHIVLIALAFLPWTKMGLQTYNPFSFIQSFLEAIGAGGGVQLVIMCILTVLALMLIVVPSAVGAFMCFAKSRSFNIGNVLAFIGCLVFLLTMSIGPMLMPEHVSTASGGGYTYQYAFRITVSFEIGFYLEIIAAAVLSILGSGKINIQEVISKAKGN